MTTSRNRLKKCPICGAQSFEDIEICYGCMHQFKEGQTQILELPKIETASIDIVIPKENRAKHRIVENEDQVSEKIEAEYKLIVSLVPA